MINVHSLTKEIIIIFLIINKVTVGIVNIKKVTVGIIILRNESDCRPAL